MHRGGCDGRAAARGPSGFQADRRREYRGLPDARAYFPYVGSTLTIAASPRNTALVIVGDLQELQAGRGWQLSPGGYIRLQPIRLQQSGVIALEDGQSVVFIAHRK